MQKTFKIDKNHIDLPLKNDNNPFDYPLKNDNTYPTMFVRRELHA